MFLMRNREKNLKKWEKHPTTFPNPLGGGLIGEYMKRPWQRELAELGRVYGPKTSRKKRAKNQRGEKEDDE